MIPEKMCVLILLISWVNAGYIIAVPYPTTAKNIEIWNGQFLDTDQGICFKGLWTSNEPAIIKWKATDRYFEKLTALPTRKHFSQRYRISHYCEFPVIDFDRDTITYKTKTYKTLRSGYKQLKTEYSKLMNEGKSNEVLYEYGFEYSKGVIIAFVFWFAGSDDSWLTIFNPDQEWFEFIKTEKSRVTSMYYNPDNSNYYLGLVENAWMADWPIYTSPGMIVYNSETELTYSVNDDQSSILNKKILHLHSTPEHLLVASISGFATFEYATKKWTTFRIKAELKRPISIFPCYFMRQMNQFLPPPIELPFAQFLLTNDHTIAKTVVVETDHNVLRCFYSIEQNIPCVILLDDNAGLKELSDGRIKLFSDLGKIKKQDDVLHLSPDIMFLNVRETCNSTDKLFNLLWSFEDRWDGLVSFYENTPGCLEVNLPFCWVDADLYTIRLIQDIPTIVKPEK